MRSVLAILSVITATRPTYLDTLEVRITNLDVVVTDKSGAPVQGCRLQRSSGAQSMTEIRTGGCAPVFARAPLARPGRRLMPPVAQAT
jgi:hypothetical protein